MTLTITGRITQTGSSIISPISVPPLTSPRQTALFHQNAGIQYITIDNPSNSQVFGDLSSGKGGSDSAANGVREVFSGSFLRNPNIEYVELDYAGNSLDFGNLLVGRQALSAASNGPNDRAIIIGGRYDYSSRIEHINVSSQGNAADFGSFDEHDGYPYGNRAISNSTGNRAVVGGEETSNRGQTHINLSNNSNSFTGGGVYVGVGAGATRQWVSGASNGTGNKGFWIGGLIDTHSGNHVEGWLITTTEVSIMTISSTATAVHWGNISPPGFGAGTTGNGVGDRIVVGGRRTDDTESGPATYTATIDYFSATSGGNSSNFGSLDISGGANAESNGFAE